MSASAQNSARRSGLLCVKICTDDGHSSESRGSKQGRRVFCISDQLSIIVQVERRGDKIGAIHQIVIYKYVFSTYMNSPGRKENDRWGDAATTNIVEGKLWKSSVRIWQHTC